MSIPKLFLIKESQSEIKKLIKSSTPIISKRLQVLLVFKKHEKTGISKREVAVQLGVNHSSVQTWCSTYISGGVK